MDIAERELRSFFVDWRSVPEVHYLERCWLLVDRGFDRRFVAELAKCGDSPLIDEVEALTDEQMAELNAAYLASKVA